MVEAGAGALVLGLVLVLFVSGLTFAVMNQPSPPRPEPVLIVLAEKPVRPAEEPAKPVKMEIVEPRQTETVQHEVPVIAAPPTPFDDAVREDEAWQKAHSVNTLLSYQQYLAIYPQGRYASPASLAQNRLMEEEHWNAVNEKNTLAALQDYLTRFPNGRFAGKARARLAPLEQAAQAERDQKDAQASQLRQQHEQLQELAGICRGKGMPRAAAYRKGLGVHPVICLAVNGSVHEWNNLMPAEWRPASMEDLELVAFIYPQRMTLVNQLPVWDPVGRPGPSIKSWRCDLTVRVLAARTGPQMKPEIYLEMYLTALAKKFNEPPAIEVSVS